MQKTNLVGMQFAHPVATLAQWVVEVELGAIVEREDEGASLLFRHGTRSFQYQGIRETT